MQCIGNRNNKVVKQWQVPRYRPRYTVSNTLLMVAVQVEGVEVGHHLVGEEVGGVLNLEVEGGGANHLGGEAGGLTIQAVVVAEYHILPYHSHPFQTFQVEHPYQEHRETCSSG